MHHLAGLPMRLKLQDANHLPTTAKATERGRQRNRSRLAIRLSCLASALAASITLLNSLVDA